MSEARDRYNKFLEKDILMALCFPEATDYITELEQQNKQMLDSLIKDVKEELETHNCDKNINTFLKWFIKTPKMEIIESVTGKKIEEVLK